MLKICVEKKASFLIPAAETFAEMWQKVTGRELEIITEDDNKSDLVVMGSDAVSLCGQHPCHRTSDAICRRAPH